MRDWPLQFASQRDIWIWLPKLMAAVAEALERKGDIIGARSAVERQSELKKRNATVPPGS